MTTLQTPQKALHLLCVLRFFSHVSPEAILSRHHVTDFSLTHGDGGCDGGAAGGRQ